jgi:alpha-N-acetylglucosaminidase
MLIRRQMNWTRRSFVTSFGGTSLSLFAAANRPLRALTHSRSEGNRGAAHEVLQRLLGAQAEQIKLQLTPLSGPESFRISGASGKIVIDGSSQSSLLMGVNHYLKHVAGQSTTWNGDCLNLLPLKLPGPKSPIFRKANVKHRFALNDTNDGYTGPYWSWEKWERQIDILAFHGINEVLVYLGAEAVYQQTFRKFGFSDQELRDWFPTPAHQPWWLLGNMSGWVGPSLSQQLIDTRVELAAKILRRLTELEIKPVLPGYFGLVPDGFSDKNRNSHILPQGLWLGMKRPDLLDPTCSVFAEVAEQFYRVQQQLIGRSSMFKMDLFHEGGKTNGADVAKCARSVYESLQKFHPGATWVALGWQNNPSPELLSGVTDKEHMLILDGLSDRYAYRDREQQWSGTPYAFGAIWNFGGRTTIGANISVWNERYFLQLAKSDSKLQGIAVMPEASCNNPAAFSFLTELAWYEQAPDLSSWFRHWASCRYGGYDSNAEQAWEILRSTVYNMKSDGLSTAQSNLFAAQPNLAAHKTCGYCPGQPRYDFSLFRKTIGHLLKVHPSLRASSAYRYDLVDVARQTISDQSRELLPRIKAAYAAGDRFLFKKLSQEWLEQIDLLESVVGTEPAFLLGPWLAEARDAAKSAEERAQLEFDARSVLVQWGPPSSRGSDLRDYANREWQGLLQFYRNRWSTYFVSLDESLERKGEMKPIDWFSFDQDWTRQANEYPLHAIGDAYTIVEQAINSLSIKEASSSGA